MLGKLFVNTEHVMGHFGHMTIISIYPVDEYYIDDATYMYKLSMLLDKTSSVRFKAMGLVVLIHFNVPSIVCWGFVFGPCFAINYLVFFLVLQSTGRGRESWLLYFNCLSDVLLLTVSNM